MLWRVIWWLLRVRWLWWRYAWRPPEQTVSERWRDEHCQAGHTNPDR
jgi:hypothetical protein